MGALGVDDEAFWGDPFAAREEVIDRLATDEVRGIVLDAPTRVRLDLRDDVPLAGARRYPGDVARAQRFRERAVLAVLRGASNEVFAARAFPSKEPARRSSPPPPRDPDDGPLTVPILTDFFALSVREQIPALPLRATALHAVILCGEERSNAVVVSLDDPPDGDPRVADFVAAHRSPGYPRAVHPPRRSHAALPRYTQSAASPELPSFGLALAVPSSVGAREPCIVHGSFALPLLERERVRPFDAHFDRFAQLTGAPWVDVGDEGAVAVAAITLVVTTDDVDDPAVLRLDVPVYDDRDGLGRGFFALNLFEAPEMFRTPGRYVLWAFGGGEVVAGPCPLDVRA